MIVYLDLIILANFILDYSLIAYTGIINQQKMHFGRLFVASLFALSGLSLFFIPNKLFFILLRVLFSFGIIYLAYSFKSVKQYFKNLLVFYFLNYITAGIIVSYDFKFTENVIYLYYEKDTTWYLLIISFIFANLLTYIYKVIEENHAFIKNTTLDVKFRILNQEYQLKGFMDTGNLVTSEGDNIPVVFIDKNIIKEEINEAYLINHKIKFTYVLTKTFNDSHLTLVFKPEYFLVSINHKWISKDVYLAFGENLKSDNLSFQAILNCKLIDG